MLTFLNELVEKMQTSLTRDKDTLEEGYDLKNRALVNADE